MNHYVGDVKERRDLQHRRAEVNEDEERRHRRVAVLHVIDQVNEDDVARYHHRHQDSRSSGVHTWRDEAMQSPDNQGESW